MYFNVFIKLIKVHLLVSELYIAHLCLKSYSHIKCDQQVLLIIWHVAKYLQLDGAP